jgi:hypothetical protein
VDKYPQSVQLLYMYASFCDTVLNDSKEADQLREQVSCRPHRSSILPLEPQWR